MQEINPGDNAVAPFMIKSVSVANTSRGSQYASLELLGSGGKEYKAKIWDWSQDMIATVSTGKIIDAEYMAKEYKGALDLHLVRFQPSVTSNVSDFARKSRFDIPGMMKKLRGTVASIENETIQRIASKLIDDVENIEVAPAATVVHNNWAGGLIEHVLSLCGLAEGVIEHYSRIYGMPVSRDKVLFGLICHDLFKCQEYDCNNPAFPRTKAGYLTNHIVAGIFNLGRVAQDIVDMNNPKEEELVRELTHLIAAHHGIEEWGSPVRPCTLEAVIIHHLDNLDSKVMHAFDLIEKGQGTKVPGMSDQSYFERVPYVLP